VDYAIRRTRIGSVDRRARLIFEEDASSWGMGARSAVILAVLPLVVAGVVAAAHLVKPIYRFLTAEDSVLEWSQVLCVAGTSVLLGLTALVLLERREWLWAGLFAGGTLAAVLIVGEEISWGQRLFAIATPEHLEAVNTQGEINVHNVRGVLRTLNFAVMIGAGLAVALPLVLVGAHELGWQAPSKVYRIVPPLALVTAFAIPFAYRFMRFVRVDGTSGSFAEMVEFSLYFGLLAFAFLLRRRIAGEARE
jgi:hypothetical protein